MSTIQDGRVGAKVALAKYLEEIQTNFERMRPVRHLRVVFRQKTINIRHSGPPVTLTFACMPFTHLHNVFTETNLTASMSHPLRTLF